MNILDRASRLRQSIGESRPILVTNLSDIRWLCGFTGSSGVLISTEDQLTLVTDGRYVEQATFEMTTHGVSCEVVEVRNQAQSILEIAKRISGPVSVRSSDVSWAFYDELRSAGLDPSASDAGFGESRRVKDEVELAWIVRAASIADEALGSVIERVGHGSTEKELRDELEYTMRRLGADGPSYDTIVASGPDNSARPHHHPTDRVLTEGDAVIIDVGALVEGYHSDMTRTFFVGGPPSELDFLYRTVSSAQLAGLAAVRAGVPGIDVHEASVAIFRDAGVLDLYPHGTGHGVGLDIHEEPFLGSRTTSDLLAGEVVTVEPGLYRGGLGGVRIEDLVLVTDVGCRILTQYPKDQRCLP